MNLHSRFPIGSVSKQFTAAALLTLAEDRKLCLEDPVAKFFPDLTRAGEISLKALLNHTSGYPDWYPLDYIDARKTQPTTIEAARLEYGTRPLDFEPGAFYSYSNTGYLIAACVVEKLTDRPFFDYLSERLLLPLGMTHTRDYRQYDPDSVKRFGRYFNGPLEALETEPDGWLTGAGGLVSTAEDLAKWNIGLQSGKVLSRESWDQMSSATLFADGRISSYGLGLNRGSRHGHPMLGHRGGVSGAVAENLLAKDFAITWLSNLETAALWPMTPALIDALIPEDQRLDPTPTVHNASRTIEIQGPTPEEDGAAIYRAIVSGTIDRSRLTEECSEYLAEQRLETHRDRLRGLGEPISVQAFSTFERSGMQVAELRFEFKSGDQRALLGRFPDGTVAEFLMQN